MFQEPDLEKPYQDREAHANAVQKKIEQNADDILFQAGMNSDYCEEFVEYLFTEVGIGESGPLVKLVTLLANNLRNPTLHSHGVTLTEMRRVLWEAAQKKAEFQI